MNEYLDLWDTRGAAAWYDVWWAALQELRAGYARIVGAAAGDIALLPTISAALTAVAESIDYRRRPKVVVTDLDFPTLVYQWLARAGEGVRVELVESPDGIHVPLDRLERAVDDRTALVATSHVFFTSGAIQDVGAVAALAHRRGALVAIDGYQAAGQLPVDVRGLGVDFYCAGGLKWLMGGSGIAFLYVRPELVGTLEPRATGWFAHREQFAFDPHRLLRHEDARRFETGTPSLAAVYAQLGGLEILAEAGLAHVRRATLTLTEDLIDRARAAGLRPKVAATPETRSGIVMLPSPDPARAVRRLADAKIVVDARPGHVRVSPFFYNVPADHRALVELLQP